MGSPTRQTAPFVLLGLLLLLAAGAVAAYVISNVDESAGREEDVTISDLAANPTRYDGETVTISGEYAENDYFSPDDAAIALVLGDDAGEQLLVLPQPSASVPEMSEDTVVRVRGTVDVVDAGDGSTAGGYLRQSGLLQPGTPEAVVEAEEVDPILPPDAVEEAPSEPTVSAVPRIVQDPQQYAGGQVTVVGEVSGVGGRGFTLTQGGVSIFVSTAGTDIAQPEQGQRVRVTADVSRLSEFRARQLAEELGREAPEPRDPYLLLRKIETGVAGEEGADG